MTVDAMIAPGFADPPMEAQAVFRLVLEAMAHPGRIVQLGGEVSSAPAPLDDAAFAVALTLFDFETPIWLDTSLATPEVTGSLRFHCGCPIVEQSEAAAFCLIGEASSIPSFTAFDHGTPEYPDRAATLIVQTDGFSEGEGWRLRGPGVKDQIELRIQGLPAGFRERLSLNRAGFPNALDFIFTHRRQLVCLPRTARLGD